MQEVSREWIATNAAPFTSRSSIIIWIYGNGQDARSLPIEPERIISYSQGFTGDMLAGEIPEIHAYVKLNNNDGRYSQAFTDNKDELEHALSAIWIGFDIDDEHGEPQTESISGGTLFVSEVSFDTKDKTATIKFEDILQFMNEEYRGVKLGFPKNIIAAAISQALEDKVVPVSSIGTEINETLTFRHQIEIPDGTTLAEALQLCANASNCALFVDRDSKIHIEPIDRTPKDYYISRDVQYIDPAVARDKSINSILLKYYDAVSGYDDYEYKREGQIGSQQIVSNPAVRDIYNAMSMTRRTYRTLQENRNVISGEYRCDPRVDIFDCIQIAANKRYVSISDLETMSLNEVEAFTIEELEDGVIDIGTFCLIALEMDFSGAWHGRFTARAVDQSNNSNLQTWGNLKLLTWGQARDYSWDEARGGYYV